MMEDMYGWMGDILRAAGAEILPHGKYLEPLGDATHEAGSLDGPAALSSGAH
jgi:hypothetical protein